MLDITDVCLDNRDIKSVDVRTWKAHESYLCHSLYNIRNSKKYKKMQSNLLFNLFFVFAKSVYHRQFFHTKNRNSFIISFSHTHKTFLFSFLWMERRRWGAAELSWKKNINPILVGHFVSQIWLVGNPYTEKKNFLSCA